MIIDLIVGCRPNMVKAAAILHAAKKFPQLKFRLIHTGQHKGVMSDPYFKELDLPEPITFDYEYDSGGNSTVRLGYMVEELGRWWRGNAFDHDKPDFAMVVGDTDSTLAGALAAAKSGIPIAHVEAGLRCGDMKMQEEINRILVDSISTKGYTTSKWAQGNLKREGRMGKLVGNVMVDSLSRFLPVALEKYPRDDNYAVFTLHRAENVDDADKFEDIMGAICEVSEIIPVVWPSHPRHGLTFWNQIKAVPPMGYLEFIALLSQARFVMTDSGGVQEETTALGIPCLTLRPNTERPETAHLGTNTVVGTDPKVIIREAKRILEFDSKPARFIEFWDGHAAERILEDICATSL